MKAYQQERPVVVCLCGSTKFREAFQRVNRVETLAGKIVLAPGCFQRDDGLDWLPEVKQRLDEILVLNVGGYIGLSTRQEIAYARQYSKRVRWLESGACGDVDVDEVV